MAEAAETADRPVREVAILCSGVALGVYLPGLEIARGLRRHGVRGRVFVLEAFQPAEVEDALIRARERHQRDFRALRMSQQLVRDISPTLDAAALAALEARLDAAGTTRLLALSGFWLPWAAAYARERPHCALEALHIDSVPSPSWLPYAQRPEFAQAAHRYFIDRAAPRAAFRLEIGEAAPVAHAQRPAELLLHGGGWSVGTFASALDDVLAAGYRASIVRGSAADLQPRAGVRNLLLDPQWRAWRDTGPEQLGEFPRLGFADADGELRYRQSDAVPDLFGITRASLAVVSKPGGSTLIDSMAAATPVLFLAPSGKHEQANAEAWIALGYGAWFEQWREQGAQREALERMHARLARDRAQVPEYCRQLAAELGPS